MDQAIQRELEIIKAGILETVPAEAIYLFGSYAYGNPTKDSDLDIYVVVPDDVQQNPLDIGADIRVALYKKVGMPMDLMIGKSSAFRRRAAGPTLQRTIARDGVRLHKKTSRLCKR
ncbi:MAG: nucleotidyltransferase domain-containing protein [Clostridia bacterium]|nr:nucleotidyltransferase domain-containing protein [Clostridia bacterium]